MKEKTKKWGFFKVRKYKKIFVLIIFIVIAIYFTNFKSYVEQGLGKVRELKESSVATSDFLIAEAAMV